MKPNELLDCPFCCGEAKTEYSCNSVWAVCKNCGAKSNIFDYKNFEDAIKVWNTRPKPSVQWPSRKDSIANGDGQGNRDEWSVGWNDCLDACQSAVEAAGLEYGLDEKFINHIKAHLKEGEKVICKICGMPADEIINTKPSNSPRGS